MRAAKASNLLLEIKGNDNQRTYRGMLFPTFTASMKAVYIDEKTPSLSFHRTLTLFGPSYPGTKRPTPTC